MMMIVFGILSHIALHDDDDDGAGGDSCCALIKFTALTLSSCASFSTWFLSGNLSSLSICSQRCLCTHQFSVFFKL
jgi:hypothetical protein